MLDPGCGARRLQLQCRLPGFGTSAKGFEVGASLIVCGLGCHGSLANGAVPVSRHGKSALVSASRLLPACVEFFLKLGRCTER